MVKTVKLGAAVLRTDESRMLVRPRPVPVRLLEPTPWVPGLTVFESISRLRRDARFCVPNFHIPSVSGALCSKLGAKTIIWVLDDYRFGRAADGHTELIEEANVAKHHQPIAGPVLHEADPGPPLPPLAILVLLGVR